MTALIIRDGANVPREISQLFIRDGGNVQREISALYIRDANNVSRLVYNPSGSLTLSVALSRDTVYGVASGSGTATTNNVSATPSGGTGPYTYAWAVSFFDNGVAPTATAPTAALTAFTQTSIGFGEAYTSTWACTVTDSLGNSAVSSDLTANFASTA